MGAVPHAGGPVACLCRLADGATGRILLSPELREAAMMGREALLLGNGSHFELWDKALYAAKEAQARQQPLPDALQDFVF